MSREVDEVMLRIALIQREILSPETGQALYAYDNVPLTLDMGTMPLFINFVGPLISNILVGSDELGREFEETRQYDMLLFLAAYGSGVEGEYYGLLTPYFKPIYTKFGSYPHLKGLEGIRDSKIVNDTGMRNPPEFLGQRYFGSRFTLQVVSRIRRLLGTGE